MTQETLSVISSGPADPQAPASVLVMDRFRDDCPPGRVIGQPAADGVLRKGVDREGILSIDNGALRIRPPLTPGWGRAGLAYGPHRRRNGLAFGVGLINGHNLSHTEPLPDGFKARLWRWAVGSETEKPLRRLIRWVRSGQKRLMWRRVRQWLKTGIRWLHVPVIEENLAVGWFPSEAPTDPLRQGNALVVHAVVPEGGELWARTGAGVLRTARGIQNLPLYYLVVLRDRGAAYYAASLPGATGVGVYPRLRLLAIDAFNADADVYAGVHQSVLGEIGFRADTRVNWTHVAVLPEFSQWYGSAHGADALTGDGALDSATADTGGRWTLWAGAFHRTDRGAVGLAETNTAWLPLNSPAGLVHLLVETRDQPVGGVAIIWRAQDEDNFWCFEVGSRQSRLGIKSDGHWSYLPAVKNCRLAPNAVHSIQVFDDGENLRLGLNGDVVYRSTFTDARLREAAGVGFRVTGGQGSVWLRRFEAHPREIPLPVALNVGDPWPVAEGRRVVVSDEFEGPPADLAGHATTVGGQRWRREIGVGTIQLTGRGAARVQASVERPCAGRTAYTIEWANPDFADVEVTVTPPGTRQGLKERGRAGLIFWQDPQNYFILSAFIGDWPAMSIAAFFQWRGFEELYDAVWSNVGNRMHWGVPHVFRTWCDGRRFLASLDGEPVLYRALTDVYPEWREFRIRRVGIVANWEWGNDTGSVFEHFKASDRT